MSIKDRLAELAPRKLCKAGEVIAGLKPDDRVAVENALAGTHSVAAVARALNYEGRQVGKSVLADHKAGRCACRASLTA